MTEAMTTTGLSVQAEEVARPDPEVPERPQRRRFTAEYKQRVLDEIDNSPPEEKAAILRREGLYSKYIAKWRSQQRAGSLAGLNQKRGPKPDPVAAENAKLRKQNAKLRKELDDARLVIDVQKKVSRLLRQDSEEAN